jgi:hypothetical protein
VSCRDLLHATERESRYPHRVPNVSLRHAALLLDPHTLLAVDSGDFGVYVSGAWRVCGAVVSVQRYGVGY